MDFEVEFCAWVDRFLGNEVPVVVKAFSFNLFEYPEILEIKFGIELIGASYFDANDPDWPCEEVWEPEQRSLEIPKKFSGRYWEDCLTLMKALVLKVLGNERASKILKSRLGVGIGFIDGDFEVLWQSIA